MLTFRLCAVQQIVVINGHSFAPICNPAFVTCTGQGSTVTAIVQVFLCASILQASGKNKGGNSTLKDWQQAVLTCLK